MSENTTVDQYLDELEIAKEDIKQAIERKGAAVSGGLSSYAGIIDTLETVDPRQQLPNGICFEVSIIDVFDLSPYDWSMVYDYSYMFMNCTNLTGFGDNLSNAFENILVCDSMFNSCRSLTTIPQLNTSKVTDMTNMFHNCSRLTNIPLLDCSSVINTTSPLGSVNLNNLTNIGGFKDLKVSWPSNFLDRVPNATVESLMNVINNLYDLTANGLSGQTLKFGTTNLNKLTDEQKAVATNKGWTLT